MARPVATTIGLLLVFPGFLLAPNLMSHLYLHQGGEPQSILHGIVVFATLIGTPWTGWRILQNV